MNFIFNGMSIRVSIGGGGETLFYSSSPEGERVITDPLMIRMIICGSASSRAARVNLAAPKAERCTLTATDLGRMIGVSGNEMRKILTERGFMREERGSLKAVGKGLLYSKGNKWDSAVLELVVR